MNENSLTQIETKTLPKEFISLANSINTLTNRIESYVKYQKELFIGAAHELKTPLAVMKLKSEITLRKKRDIEKYDLIGFGSGIYFGKHHKKLLKFIDEIPKTLSRKKYLEIENILRDIGKEVDLKLSELDLYIWYLRTGKVLK